ncbi:MAG: hypothetical protein HYZ84_06610 [Candidatus Omnitrophica bacterium]|nr:hypothetical protein [Candidatus Omnitrophota bacterium]
MHKAYIVGIDEKHRLDFHLNWLTGFVTVSVDRKVVLRKLFFFRIDHSFEIGSGGKHIITVHYNLFDYFHEIFLIKVDGQPTTPEMEIQTHHEKIDTAVEDAACALLFVGGVNLIFAVVGTVYVPDLDALRDRMLLLLGALIYFLFAVRVILRQKQALAAGTIFFTLDSILQLAANFSVAGMVLRVAILFYFASGIRSFRTMRAISEA